jgi:hypothetical protein
MRHCLTTSSNERPRRLGGLVAGALNSVTAILTPKLL